MWLTALNKITSHFVSQWLSANIVQLHLVRCLGETSRCHHRLDCSLKLGTPLWSGHVHFKGIGLASCDGNGQVHGSVDLSSREKLEALGIGPVLDRLLIALSVVQVRLHVRGHVLAIVVVVCAFAAKVHHVLGMGVGNQSRGEFFSPQCPAHTTTGTSDTRYVRGSEHTLSLPCFGELF